MKVTIIGTGAVGIHVNDLRAYILGEHGDSQFPAMSVALAGGALIGDSPECRALSLQAKTSGVEIFNKKGNTCFAIAHAAAMVVQSILHDERTTIPLSVEIDGYLGIRDLCLSLPVVVGKNGIERVLHPNLNSAEQEAFHQSAQVVSQPIKGFRGSPMLRRL